jgi:hypothetical protein
MFEGKTLLLSGPQVDYTNYRGGLRKTLHPLRREIPPRRPNYRINI